jgi:hypothetical protein
LVKDTFLALPSASIKRLVHEAGSKVWAFPINGTRRWFALEHADQVSDNPISAYLDITGKSHIDLYRLFFDYGVETLLAPVFGPDLTGRGDDYTQMAADGLARLATHPNFLSFYREYGVRVRFYGDYRKFFASTPFDYLPDLFDEATANTCHHQQHRLFFGVCAHDAVETTAELGIRYYNQHGKSPDKQALIEMYYGEYVPPLNLFIGFDKFCVFDTPLLTTGNEDLYFTISPSLYFTEDQLREILYDHLYTRRAEETDYSDMSPDDWELMRDFYDLNNGKTLGVGAKQHHGEFWYPLPQVELPAEFLGAK